MRVVAVLLLALITNFGDGANILGVFHSFGYSQFILAEKLMMELANRGHHVSVIASYSPKNPHKNYRTILIENLAEIVNATEALSEVMESSLFSTINLMYQTFGPMMTEEVLTASSVQQLLKSKNETFDLIIVEQFVNEAHMGFAAHFKAPLIMFSSLRSPDWINFLVGNPSPPSYVPNTLVGYRTHMTYVERVWNTIFYVYDIAVRYFIGMPQQEKLLKKYFSEDLTLDDLIKNVSFLLVNSHPVLNEPLPSSPNFIEIGGFHVASKPLPTELQEYLDNAKDGVIFFSLGSNMRSIDLPEDMRKSILKVFSGLKQKVLWKFEDEDLPGKPENVYISKWFPQNDILGHPNVKLFISHCGLLSTIETIYAGVPVLCIPIFADQPMNAARNEYLGIGLSISLKTLNEETLSTAIATMLTDNRYNKNMKETSLLLKDNPQKPMDLAMFWIEYTLRHKGAGHLRHAGCDLTWYQYLLLDVASFFLVIVSLAYLTLSKLLRMIRKEELQKKQKMQ